MIYFCSQQNRRALVLQHPTLNGVDYLEVCDDDGDCGCGTRLLITLLKDARHVALTPAQVRITGGSSTAQVTAVAVAPGTNAAPLALTVELDQPGDFSAYTLSLVASPTTGDPPRGFDPQLSTVAFSFKAGCATVGDCVPETCCPPEAPPKSDINYLAKDYDGFRQVMLDRLAVLVPVWTETHAADMGVALVELLAYAADHLSYQQDAVGTEAYLGTARSRISLRRHARLVDYRIGEGRNARTWVYAQAARDGVFVPSGGAAVLAFDLNVTDTNGEIGGASVEVTVRNVAAAPIASNAGTQTAGPAATVRDAADRRPHVDPGANQTVLAGAAVALAGSATVVAGAAIASYAWTQIAGPPVALAGANTATATFTAPPVSGPLFLPRVAGLPVAVRPGTTLAQTLLNSSSLGFTPVQDSWLYLEQNEMHVYTWSDANCCLAPGATEATLEGTLTSLAAGSVLLFEEVMGPLTGDPEDADPAKRWAVRLTAVQRTDYFGDTLRDPLNLQPITRIWWAPEDALPFPLCISSTSDAAHGSRALFRVSVARGNIIPVDHGIWGGFEDLGEVPPAPAGPVLEGSCTCGAESPVAAARPRFFPALARASLTFAEAFDAAGPASAFLAPPDAVPAAPQLSVSDDQGQNWAVLDDLLSSDEFQRVCVVEIERDGTAFLRFGDGQYGAAPEAGASFHALYRVGNGTAGNIGRDTLAHVLTTVGGIAEVRNPLAASGGVDPETMEHIRQQAPAAFRTQLRAVTPDDYGAMAQRDPAVSEARGTLRWTGSWYTAFVSVDAAADAGPDASLLVATKQRLNLLRMAGVDLEVEGAVIVGLRIELDICADPDHFQSDVRDAVLRLFVTGDLCDGQRGLLNPENFTFGETVYTSPFVAAAQGVEGVSSATLTVFQRMDDPSIDGAAQGYLTMGRLELARCDNDPNRLDRGIFVVHMDGGK